MTDREALLRAIVTSPDEDTPRLMFADLLDDLGGNANAARARFIRLQIETFRGPGDTEKSLFDRKCAEIDMLGVRYGKQWLAEFPAGVAPANASPVTSHAFKRGFVEGVWLYFNSFSGNGFDFLALNPIKTFCGCNGKTEQLTALLASANLAPLQEIRFFSCEFRDCHLHKIAGSHLPTLQNLDLGSCLISNRGLTALAQGEALPELQTLRIDCTGKGLTDSGIADLLTSLRLPKLREIDLRHRRRQFWLSTKLQTRFPGARILY